ncbi:MAG: hypothetical protein ACT4PV_05090 [Planctomycetaceae bacterium]
MNLKPPQAGSSRRSSLLSLLVVAAAAVSIFLIRQRDRASEEEAAREQEQPIKVSNPFEMSGEIVSASWRQGAVVEEPPIVELDAEDRLPTPEEDETSREERELRKVLDPVEGLGVYVAPREEEETKGDGR